MTIQYLIIDIDGTLADSTHRACYLQRSPKDWDRFFSLVHLDAPIEPNITVIKGLLNAGAYPIFVTGRPDSCKVGTEAWLRQHLFDGNDHDYAIYFRNSADRRPDFAVKQEIAFRFLIPSNINGLNSLVFEDRTDCAKMWRDLGFTCFQVSNDLY